MPPPLSISTTKRRKRRVRRSCNGPEQRTRDRRGGVGVDPRRHREVHPKRRPDADGNRDVEPRHKTGNLHRRSPVLPEVAVQVDQDAAPSVALAQAVGWRCSTAGSADRFEEVRQPHQAHPVSFDTQQQCDVVELES